MLEYKCWPWEEEWLGRVEGAESLIQDEFQEGEADKEQSKCKKEIGDCYCW